MAVAVDDNLPSGCWRQPTESKGVDTSGNAHFNYVLKGPYNTLETLAAGISQGDEVVAGWLANTLDLQRGRGGSGILTIGCVPYGGQTEGQNPETKPLKDIWSLRSVRNDVSVMAYCGVSPGANPLRALVEAWMKEPDGELADELKFRRPDGTICEIVEGPTIALINKIRKGVESVIRFYPVVTRTRTYSAPPPKCLENLGYIDTPDASGIQDLTKKPNGITTAIADHEWLKIQDDAVEGTDGKWQRIESWMGIKKTDNNGGHPWDSDLYGPNRWTMPYFQGGGGGGAA